MKKGQISIEVLYAVSIVLILFTLLSVLALERRGDVRRMEDFMNKRGECFRLSTLIAGAASTGDRAVYDFYSHYNINVESRGFINVRDLNVTGTSQEVFCSFHAVIADNYTLADGNYKIIGGFGIVNLVSAA